LQQLSRGGEAFHEVSFREREDILDSQGLPHNACLISVRSEDYGKTLIWVDHVEWSLIGHGT
jgi:hypothetical protein